MRLGEFHYALYCTVRYRSNAVPQHFPQRRVCSPLLSELVQRDPRQRVLVVLLEADGDERIGDAGSERDQSAERTAAGVCLWCAQSGSDTLHDTLTPSFNLRERAQSGAALRRCAQEGTLLWPRLVCSHLAQHTLWMARRTDTDSETSGLRCAVV